SSLGPSFDVVLWGVPARDDPRRNLPQATIFLLALCRRGHGATGENREDDQESVHSHTGLNARSPQKFEYSVHSALSIRRHKSRIDIAGRSVGLGKYQDVSDCDRRKKAAGLITHNVPPAEARFSYSASALPRRIRPAYRYPIRRLKRAPRSARLYRGARHRRYSPCWRSPACRPVPWP